MDEGDTHNLQRLLTGADVEQQDLDDYLILALAGQPPIHGAPLESVKLLVELGADVNYRNEHGETPFSFTCAWNRFDCAKYLYEQGVEINTVDERGGSPLDWAVCHASQEFRDWLLSIGARRHDDSYEPWLPPELREKSEE